MAHSPPLSTHPVPVLSCHPQTPLFCLLFPFLHNLTPLCLPLAAHLSVRNGPPSLPPLTTTPTRPTKNAQCILSKSFYTPYSCPTRPRCCYCCRCNCFCGLVTQFQASSTATTTTTPKSMTAQRRSSSSSVGGVVVSADARLRRLNELQRKKKKENINKSKIKMA